MFCPCFILRVEGKNVEKKMDLAFNHPIFDSDREKVKRAMEQLEKSQETLKIHCTLASNVGATRYFLSQNRLGLLMKVHLYSTSIVIVTINRGMDDYSPCNKFAIMNRKGVVTAYMIQ